MHEVTVTENILEITLRHAKEVKATRVTDIFLVIGDLSTIIDDSVQFYWDIISERTLAEGAQLHFERVHAKLRCLECGEVYVAPDQMSPCPKCESVLVSVEAGEEFYLASIDVEADDLEDEDEDEISN